MSSPKGQQSVEAAEDSQINGRGTTWSRKTLVEHSFHFDVAASVDLMTMKVDLLSHSGRESPHHIRLKTMPSRVLMRCIPSCPICDVSRASQLFKRDKNNRE